MKVAVRSRNRMRPPPTTSRVSQISPSTLVIVTMSWSAPAPFTKTPEDPSFVMLKMSLLSARTRPQLAQLRTREDFAFSPRVSLCPCSRQDAPQERGAPPPTHSLREKGKT